VLQAIRDGTLCILAQRWSVHGLQKEMREAECRKPLGRRIKLWKDELQLITRHEYERCSRFWTHANPIEPCHRTLRPICLDADLEAARVQRIDCRGIELEKWLTPGTHHILPCSTSHRSSPRRVNRIG
jgi:hypothetical protein